jgi:3-hydroxyacyl-CoA dehydrogenase
MGAAIAYVAAAAGHQVILVDRDRERLDALPGRFRASHRMRRLVAGRVPAADPEQLAASVVTSVDVAAVAESALVVENVTEDLAAKAEVARVERGELGRRAGVGFHDYGGRR